jgi:hypothetical protein
VFVIGSKNVLISNTMADNMILDSPDELLRLTLSFLGVGHFAFVALVCSRFKIAHLANVGDEMITSGESVTSSILRAEKYFEDAGTDSEHLIFFWLNVTRYGRVDVMEWAHREGCSRVWNEGFRGRNVGDQLCRRAAEYGQLAGLQWLRQNGCSWSSGTSSAAAGGWSNGCEWDSSTCSVATEGGHLTVLQWARANECPWECDTYHAARRYGNPDLLTYIMGCHRKTLNETINIMKIKCMKFFIYYHLLRHLLYFPLLIKTGNPTIKEIATFLVLFKLSDKP